MAQNAYGWFYINHGKVDFSYTGLAQNAYGWWKIVGGVVDCNCNGLEVNEYGWWKVTGGLLTSPTPGWGQWEAGGLIISRKDV